jgi:hypothetical protein
MNLTDEQILKAAEATGITLFGLGMDKAKFEFCILAFGKYVGKIERFKEREACEALHEHEDVQAPIGNSSWGEAYQEGWAQGTAAYRVAMRARGEQE